MARILERAETFLRTNRECFFCAACLARELGVTAFEGRSVIWKLQALAGYEMRGGRCARCLRGKRVIRHVAHVPGPGATGNVVAFLLSNAGTGLCDACLAFATDRSLADVRCALDELTPFAEFHRHDAVCIVCSRTTPVTRAVLDESTATPDEIGTVLAGTELYQGWRLDLRSYRIADGWRPFVLIKGQTVSRVPPAPELLWATCPSRVDADRLALRAAKKWIDKLPTS